MFLTLPAAAAAAHFAVQVKAVLAAKNGGQQQGADAAATAPACKAQPAEESAAAVAVAQANGSEGKKKKSKEKKEKKVGWERGGEGTWRVHGCPARFAISTCLLCSLLP